MMADLMSIKTKNNIDRVNHFNNKNNNKLHNYDDDLDDEDIISSKIYSTSNDSSSIANSNSSSTTTSPDRALDNNVLVVDSTTSKSAGQDSLLSTYTHKQRTDPTSSKKTHRSNSIISKLFNSKKIQKSVSIDHINRNIAEPDYHVKKKKPIKTNSDKSSERQQNLSRKRAKTTFNPESHHTPPPSLGIRQLLFPARLNGLFFHRSHFDPTGIKFSKKEIMSRSSEHEDQDSLANEMIEFESRSFEWPAVDDQSNNHEMPDETNRQQEDVYVEMLPAYKCDCATCAQGGDCQEASNSETFELMANQSRTVANFVSFVQNPSINSLENNSFTNKSFDNTNNTEKYSEMENELSYLRHENDMQRRQINELKGSLDLVTKSNNDPTSSDREELLNKLIANEKRLNQENKLLQEETTRLKLEVKQTQYRRQFDLDNMEKLKNKLKLVEKFNQTVQQNGSGNSELLNKLKTLEESESELKRALESERAKCSQLNMKLEQIEKKHAERKGEKEGEDSINDESENNEQHRKKKPIPASYYEIIEKLRVVNELTTSSSNPLDSNVETKSFLTDQEAIVRLHELRESEMRKLSEVIAEHLNTSETDEKASPVDQLKDIMRSYQIEIDALRQRVDNLLVEIQIQRDDGEKKIAQLNNELSVCRRDFDTYKINGVPVGHLPSATARYEQQINIDSFGKQRGTYSGEDSAIDELSPSITSNSHHNTQTSSNSVVLPIYTSRAEFITKKTVTIPTLENEATSTTYCIESDNVDESPIILNNNGFDNKSRSFSSFTAARDDMRGQINSALDFEDKLNQMVDSIVEKLKAEVQKEKKECQDNESRRESVDTKYEKITNEIFARISNQLEQTKEEKTFVENQLMEIMSEMKRSQVDKSIQAQDYETKLRLLNEQLEDARNQYKQVKDLSTSRYEELLSQLSERLGQSQDEKLGVQRKLETILNELKQYQSDMSKLKATSETETQVKTVSNVDFKLEAILNELKTYQVENMKLTEKHELQIKSLNDQLERTREEKASIESRLGEILAELKTYQTSNAALASNYEKQLKLLNEQLDDSKSEKSELEKKLLSELLDMKKSQRDMNESNQRQCASLIEQLEQTRSEKQSMEVRVSQLFNDLKQYQKDKEWLANKYEEQVKNLNDQLTLLQNEHLKIKNENSGLKSKQARIDEDHQKVIDKFENEIQQLTNQASRYKQEIKTFKDENTRQLVKNQELLELIDKTSADFTRKSTDYNNELAKANIQLNKLKFENENLKSENDRVLEENKEFRIKLLKFNEELKRTNEKNELERESLQKELLRIKMSQPSQQVQLDLKSEEIERLTKELDKMKEYKQKCETIEQKLEVQLRKNSILHDRVVQLNKEINSMDIPSLKDFNIYSDPESHDNHENLIKSFKFLVQELKNANSQPDTEILRFKLFDLEKDLNMEKQKNEELEEKLKLLNKDRQELKDLLFSNKRDKEKSSQENIEYIIQKAQKSVQQKQLIESSSNRSV